MLFIGVSYRFLSPTTLPIATGAAIMCMKFHQGRSISTRWCYRINIAVLHKLYINVEMLMSWKEGIGKWGVLIHMYLNITYTQIDCFQCCLYRRPLSSHQRVPNMHVQHMVLAVCPSYLDASLLTNGPCNDLLWLCYYGDDIPGWTLGGGV